MEKTDLRDPAYWEVPGIDIRLNPRLDLGVDGLESFVRTELGLDSAVVFATSGSTGAGPKFVVLEKQSLLASAIAVNRHLEVNEGDRWLCALTTFHVGGVGVWARGYAAECGVFEIDGERWDKSGSTFLSACKDQGITLTALTPTHLHDVVANDQKAPESLRAVMIGGDALEPELLGNALRLGWPILRTYGMTEAASQIATDFPEEAESPSRPDLLPVISGWEARSGAGGELEIRGAALFSGYASRDREAKNWKAETPFSPDGFFSTGDRVRLESSERGETALAFSGRTDDVIKTLGEQVSLTKLRESIRGHFPGIGATVLAIRHDRKGNELVAVIESRDSGSILRTMKEFNRSVAPFERVERVYLIERLPLTEIGKVAHGRLAAWLEAGKLKPVPHDSGSA